MTCLAACESASPKSRMNCKCVRFGANGTPSCSLPEAQKQQYDNPLQCRRAISMVTSTSVITRVQIEDLLFEEAALLDEWRLRDWLELLTDDVVYEVPSTDVPDGDSRSTLFIVADNAERLRLRVEQLLGKSAWAENPKSRTRRLISNVRIREADGDTLKITANFVVYRMRSGHIDTYIGRY